ncbi:MAG: hypothetical protein QF921_15930 [Pseudomonadales bacterium]|nr:hypothetical protein [Pseudomonadales bacterium]MDP6470499.1 hypothetical protein [Pseudomonadales bacterium]MDP6827801.1 hypothetical protein [Pseudomonadales bacterium]MDP6972973.1 hypothetical protein [Pseudomonadales bacterium]
MRAASLWLAVGLILWVSAVPAPTNKPILHGSQWMAISVPKPAAYS